MNTPGRGSEIVTPIDPEAPLALHSEVVRPEWVDYNGHMNVAYYGLVFDNASDVVFESLGVDADYRRATGCSWFVVESHGVFRDEVSEGTVLRIRSRLLGYDSKRLHLFHRMYGNATTVAAATEFMCLHVDLGARRAVPWRTDVQTAIRDLYEAQRDLPLPAEAGRSFRALSNSGGEATGRTPPVPT